MNVNLIERLAITYERDPLFFWLKLILAFIVSVAPAMAYVFAMSSLGSSSLPILKVLYQGFASEKVYWGLVVGFTALAVYAFYQFVYDTSERVLKRW